MSNLLHKMIFKKRLKYRKLSSTLMVTFFFIFSWGTYLLSVGYEKALLREIANNIEGYRNKNITLKLKLKNIDRIFDKLTFYDGKNNDIVFDTSKIKSKDQFKRQILNLHEGMAYLVKFIVSGVGDFGNIIGELISFEPYVLKKLPEG